MRYQPPAPPGYWLRELGAIAIRFVVALAVCSALVMAVAVRCGWRP